MIYRPVDRLIDSVVSDPKTGTNTFNVSGGAGGTGDRNGDAGGAGIGKEIYIG